MLEKATDKTTIEFWHAMKGANAAAIDKLVADFNAQSGGKVEVKAVFQGSYDETIAKYKASVQQKNTPALVQIYDIGSRFMVDSKQVVPMYKFVDKDGFKVGDIEPNIANYYSIDGKLQSMPFNTSTHCCTSTRRPSRGPVSTRRSRRGPSTRSGRWQRS